MKKYKIAILGASGAVGKEILKQLEIANLPIQQIKCLASKNSIGHFLFLEMKNF